MSIEEYIEQYEDQLLAQWANLVKPETFPAFCERKYNQYKSVN